MHNASGREISVVVLAFAEMSTPYASGQAIHVQKFSTYTNKIEKRMAHFKSTFTTIKRFSKILFANDACFHFTILGCLPWSFASCVIWDVETKSHFFAYTVRIDSMIFRIARFLCVPYAEICVNMTAEICIQTYWNAYQQKWEWTKYFIYLII